VKLSSISMNKQKAIEDTLTLMDPYLKQDVLNDAQAARIGRTLFANLRQAERNDSKEDLRDRG
jgi:hypothetical protein